VLRYIDSYSAGRTRPMEVCSRAELNQCAYSAVTFSTSAKPVQVRRFCLMTLTGSPWTGTPVVRVRCPRLRERGQHDMKRRRHTLE